MSEVRKYLPEIYKLPVCLGLQSGGREEEEKRRESKPNIEVGKKVQWAEEEMKVHASTKAAHSLIQRAIRTTSGSLSVELRHEEHASNLAFTQRSTF